MFKMIVRDILLSGCFLNGSGVKTDASTAFGMTETMHGSIFARNTVFSLLKKQSPQNDNFTPQESHKFQY